MSGEKRQFARAKKTSHGNQGKPKQRHKDFSHGQHRGWTPGAEGHGKSHKALYWADCSLCGTAFQVPFKPAPGKTVYCNECIKTVKK